METLEMAEVSQWDDAPPPPLEEQEMDILAFELWRRASCQDIAPEEEGAGTEVTVASHASCL
jgi:hypothetical protein